MLQNVVANPLRQEDVIRMSTINLRTVFLCIQDSPDGITTIGKTTWAQIIASQLQRQSDFMAVQAILDKLQPAGALIRCKRTLSVNPDFDPASLEDAPVETAQPPPEITLPPRQLIGGTDPMPPLPVTEATVQLPPIVVPPAPPSAPSVPRQRAARQPNRTQGATRERALEDEVARLRRINAELRAENDDLREQLEAAKEAAALQELYEEEVTRLNEEIGRLRDELLSNELQADHDRRKLTDDAQAALQLAEEAGAEVRRLTQELRDALAGLPTGQLEAKNRTLRGINERLRTNVATLNAKLALANRLNTDLQQQLTEADAENDQLQEALEQVETGRTLRRIRLGCGHVAIVMVDADHRPPASSTLTRCKELVLAEQPT